jgi:hypothetical protein
MRHHYFRHFRLFDDRDNLLSKGGVTVYVRHFTWNYGKSEADEATAVEVSTAVCSHKDHYNKRIGRRVAFGRRYERNNTIISLSSEDQDITHELYLIAVRAIREVHFKGKFDHIDLVHKHDTLDCGDGSDLAPLHTLTDAEIQQVISKLEKALPCPS